MKKPQYEMIVEKTSTGYSAYCEAVGAFTTGVNADELKANIVAVLNLALGDTAPGVTIDDAKLTCDLPSFFDAYKVINASALAKRLGMTQSLLSQYISGVKTPSEKQTHRILEGIRQVGRELSEMEFA
ncbi:helix-turn-helix domain-containing protein [Hymenobacter lapidiphilus]|uniref:Helix-turn-helix transcriptional regulator n=1 Tax=Hymenobacter lapidiphilus TaxID=2608003 RepID=A0A7Y7PSC7_9BACT|nr:helix-turn-helix transcriptional regulator [Hymenobacter lapidiphilus]NVO33141.1 helix-turn-helix transcriptional regulator [Hymenobacter lapidiphilus]